MTYLLTLCLYTQILKIEQQFLSRVTVSIITIYEHLRHDENMKKDFNKIESGHPLSVMATKDIIVHIYPFAIFANIFENS